MATRFGHKLRKMLATSTLGTTMLLAMPGAGCDAMVGEFMKGVQLGYAATTGENLFGGPPSASQQSGPAAHDGWSDSSYGGYDDGFSSDGYDDGWYGFDDSDFFIWP